MFAITNVHVGVVKELVLAKANISLRNRVSRSGCGSYDKETYIFRSSIVIHSELNFSILLH